MSSPSRWTDAACTKALAGRCVATLAGAMSFCALMLAAGWVTWQLLPPPSALAASLSAPPPLEAASCAPNCGLAGNRGIPGIPGDS